MFEPRRRRNLVRLELSAVLDDDWFACCSVSRSDLLNRGYDVVSVDNGTEDDVFTVEPRRLRGAQEELTSVGVRTGIGHTQYSRSDVCESEVFIGELIAVNGLSAGPVVASEVAALTHETGNDAVEGTALEGELSALLAGAECTEVLSGLWYHIGTEFHGDTTSISAANGDIEEDLRVRRVRDWVISGHDESGVVLK